MQNNNFVNFFLFSLIILVLNIRCTSVKHTPRFFSINKKGVELNINYSPFNYNIEDYKITKSEKITYLNNPFSPIPWYSFTMPQADSVKILLYLDAESKGILYSGYLKVGNYYINFKKVKVPSGFYYLKFISTRYTIVKQIFIGRDK